jgi:hypothetical protein
MAWIRLGKLDHDCIVQHPPIQEEQYIREMSSCFSNCISRRMLLRWAQAAVCNVKPHGKFMRAKGACCASPASSLTFLMGPFAFLTPTYACLCDRQKDRRLEPASIALMSQINCLRDTMLVLLRIARHKAFQTLACACGHRSVPLKRKAIDLQVGLSSCKSHFSFSSALGYLLQDLNKDNRTSF